MPKIFWGQLELFCTEIVVENQGRLEDGQGNDHSFYSDPDKSFDDVKYTLQCIQNGEMGYICIRG